MSPAKRAAPVALSRASSTGTVDLSALAMTPSGLSTSAAGPISPHETMPGSRRVFRPACATRGRQHRGDLVPIVAASAQVPAQRLAHLVRRGLRVLLHERNARHDHPGRAVSALTAHVTHEAFLHRMQCPVLADSFDRGDVVTRRVEREQHAGIDGQPVHQHRAGAALPQIAGLLRAGQAEVFAKCEEQRALMRHSKRARLPVDAQLDIRVRGLVTFAPIRRRADSTQRGASAVAAPRRRAPLRRRRRPRPPG